MRKERRSLTQAIEKVAERIVHEHEEYHGEPPKKADEKSSNKGSDLEPELIQISSSILP